MVGARSSAGRAGAAALLAAGALGACSGAGEPRARSVVLFTVDTLRADALGVHGGPPTPHVDRLAGESLVFESAYSQATNTHPSLSSMLSGLIPLKHGVLNQPRKLHEGVVPLAVLLKANGIRTGSFVANLCKLQDVPSTVFSEGWDERFCGMDPELELEQWTWDDAVIDAALAWMAEQEEPWFAWIHLMDPHDEHRPPRDEWDWEADPPKEKLEQLRWLTEWEEERSRPPDEVLDRILAMYAAEVRGIDRKVGRVLGALDGPLGEDVALVFSADHGEEFFETWHRLGHGLSLTEGVLRVPLMVRAPGLEPGVVRAPVETMAVTPTVLELFGLTEPGIEFDAPSLLADEPSRGFALTFEEKIAVTVREDTDRYWFRYSPEPWTREHAPWRAEARWFQERESLARYDPDRPNEPRWLDLSFPSNRERAARLHERVARYYESIGDLNEAPRIDDPALRAQLEALGYLPGE